MCNLDDIISKNFEKNEKLKIQKGQQPCLVCGKPLWRDEATSKWLHMTTDGELSEIETSADTSQGWFLVGPDCYKKYLKHKK
jgi:hypothetical protein